MITIDDKIDLSVMTVKSGAGRERERERVTCTFAQACLPFLFDCHHFVPSQ